MNVSEALLARPKINANYVLSSPRPRLTPGSEPARKSSAMKPKKMIALPKSTTAKQEITYSVYTM